MTANDPVCASDASFQARDDSKHRILAARLDQPIKMISKKVAPYLYLSLWSSKHLLQTCEPLPILALSRARPEHSRD